jgi:hypothetical protein
MQTIQLRWWAIHDIELARPYCSCRFCHQGRSPFDDALGLTPGRLHLDGQQAAGDLAIA